MVIGEKQKFGRPGGGGWCGIDFDTRSRLSILYMNGVVIPALG